MRGHIKCLSHEGEVVELGETVGVRKLGEGERLHLSGLEREKEEVCGLKAAERDPPVLHQERVVGATAGEGILGTGGATVANEVKVAVEPPVEDPKPMTEFYQHRIPARQQEVIGGAQGSVGGERSEAAGGEGR